MADGFYYFLCITFCHRSQGRFAIQGNDDNEKFKNLNIWNPERSFRIFAGNRWNLVAGHSKPVFLSSLPTDRFHLNLVQNRAILLALLRFLLHLPL